MTIVPSPPLLTVPAARVSDGARWIGHGASLVCDLVAFLAAYAVVAYGLGGAPGADPVEGTLILAGALTVAFRFPMRLYPGYRLHHEEGLRRRLLTLAAAGLVTATAALLLANGSLHTFAALAVYLALAGALQLVLDALVPGLLHRMRLWGRPVAIVGAPERCAGVAQFLRSNWRYGLVPADDRDGIARTALVADEELPSAASLRLLREIYDEVIVLSDLPRMRLSGLQPSDVNSEIGLRFVKPRRPGYAGKRAVDLALAVPAAILATPLVILAGIAIFVVDPGPIYYRQVREGFGGRQIGVLKLRTMYRNAERVLEDILARDPEARAEWETHFKLRRDPRILPVVGPILRATSVDELLQLINVLAGQMSLVGPRPFPAYHLAAMREEIRAKRATVMPGLTGFWQISERSDADVDTQELLDEFYIDNIGFWFDVSIILRTISCVLKFRGV